MLYSLKSRCSLRIPDLWNAYVLWVTAFCGIKWAHGLFSMSNLPPGCYCQTRDQVRIIRGREWNDGCPRKTYNLRVRETTVCPRKLLIQSIDYTWLDKWGMEILMLILLTTCFSSKKMSFYENTTGYLKNHWTKHRLVLYSFWCISMLIPNKNKIIINNSEFFQKILKT